MNGPNLWSKLLHEAPEGSAIMGGAIVDWAWSERFYKVKEPKDIDIFHTYRHGMPVVPNYWKFLEMDYNDPIKKAAHDAEYLLKQDGGHGEIGSVYDYDLGDYHVQLIGVHYADPRQYIAKFDHSLTLGMFSKDGLCIHANVFESFKNKTVTYLGKPGDNGSTKAIVRALNKIQRLDPVNVGAWEFAGFD